MSPTSFANRAADFRNAFDKTYTLPRATGNQTTWEDFLAIRIASTGFAIRLREISGLLKGRRVVACPSQVPEFQGIAGVRGTLVSVYSLPALLGYNIGVEHAPWLLLCAKRLAESGEETIGFAFPEFSAFVRALPSQIHSATDGDAPSSHSARTAQFLRIDGEVRAIVALPRLVKRCLGQAAPPHAAQTPEANREY